MSSKIVTKVEFKNAIRPIIKESGKTREDLINNIGSFFVAFYAVKQPI